MCPPPHCQLLFLSCAQRLERGWLRGQREKREGHGEKDLWRREWLAGVFFLFFFFSWREEMDGVGDMEPWLPPPPPPPPRSLYFFFGGERRKGGGVVGPDPPPPPPLPHPNAVIMFYGRRSVFARVTRKGWDRVRERGESFTAGVCAAQRVCTSWKVECSREKTNRSSEWRVSEGEGGHGLR